MAKIKKNTIYWVGRPEISLAGRFGKRVTTYNTATMDDSGKIVYKKQSYTSLGKLGVPSNVIVVSKKSDFLKMIK